MVRKLALLAHPRPDHDRLLPFQQELKRTGFDVTTVHDTRILLAQVRELFSGAQDPESLVLLHFAGSAVLTDHSVLLRSDHWDLLSAGVLGSAAAEPAAAYLRAALAGPGVDIKDVLLLCMQSKAHVVLLVDAPLTQFSSAGSYSDTAAGAPSAAAVTVDCAACPDQHMQTIATSPEVLGWPPDLLQRSCEWLGDVERATLPLTVIIGNACAMDHSLRYTQALQEVLFDSKLGIINSLSAANKKVAMETSSGNGSSGQPGWCQLPRLSMISTHGFQQPLCSWPGEIDAMEESADITAAGELDSEDLTAEEADLQRLFMDVAVYLYSKASTDDLWTLRDIIDLCQYMSYPTIDNPSQALHMLAEQGLVTFTEADDGEKAVYVPHEVRGRAIAQLAGPSSKYPYMCIKSSDEPGQPTDRLGGLVRLSLDGYGSTIPSQMLFNVLQDVAKSCPRLEVLTLRHSDVPSKLSIDRLQNLRVLKFDCSQSSSLPGLSTCSSLAALLANSLVGIPRSGTHRKSLHGTHNKLQLPTAWHSQLQQLQVLQLSSNHLSGPLPVKWSELRSLRQLQLSSNQLVGELPVAWGALTSLTSLDLQGNKLRGSIPQSWSSLTRLRSLRLGRNKLSGYLPGAPRDALVQDSLFARATSQLLSVPENRPSSPSSTVVMDSFVIVAGWKHSLAELELSCNKLCGGLPEAWESLAQLSRLVLDSNNLRGVIPSSWKRLKALQHVSISRNQISGTLPSEWFGLQQLRSVNLKSNRLEGRLPPEWARLSNLTSINLGNNKLSGPLPRTWGTLRKLRELSLKGNMLTGPLPVEWSELASLKVLRLNKNHLQGQLPHSWGHGMSQLSELRLERNWLVKSVPTSWHLLPLVQRNAGFSLKLTKQSPTAVQIVDKMMSNQLFQLFPATVALGHMLVKNWESASDTLSRVSLMSWRSSDTMRSASGSSVNTAPASADTPTYALTYASRSRDSLDDDEYYSIVEQAW